MAKKKKKTKRKGKKGKVLDPAILSELEEVLPDVQFKTDTALPKFLRRPIRGVAPSFQQIPTIGIKEDAQTKELKERGKFVRDVVIPPFRSIFKVDPFSIQGAGLLVDF